MGKEAGDGEGRMRAKKACTDSYFILAWLHLIRLQHAVHRCSIKAGAQIANGKEVGGRHVERGINREQLKQGTTKHVQLAGPPAALHAAAAALAAARAAPSALHTRRCPPCRQSACEQAVPQYHTARQALRERDGVGRGGREVNIACTEQCPLHFSRLTAPIHPPIQPTLRTCTACCPRPAPP